MELPRQAIEELKDLYRKHRGIELPDKVATELAEMVLKLFAVVYRPIPKSLLEEQKNDLPEHISLFDKSKKTG